jgi:hypothetical protein
MISGFAMYSPMTRKSFAFSFILTIGDSSDIMKMSSLEFRLLLFSGVIGENRTHMDRVPT